MTISKKTPKKKKKAKVKAHAEGDTYILRLFVTGLLLHSTRAIINSKAICEKYLKGRYELEVIDIYKQPSLALQEGIIAVPVLIKKYPLPEERVIGDLSDTEKVVSGLHLV